MFNNIVKKLLFLFTYGISMQCIAVSELLELEKDRVSSCESEFKESVENSRSSSGASSKAEVGGRVKSISFSGCGAYYPYQCGIASYLRKHFELEGVITLGASGGVLPALSLVMDVPAEKFEQFFVNEITGIMVTGLARYWFGGATRWLGVTREMLATLPVDTYERASGKVYVSATRLNRFGVQEEHITGWKSNDEMIEAILCSTYIPFFSDGFLYKTYKGRKYVDGAILNLQPIYDEDTCCIHPRLWRAFPWWDSLHFKRPLEEYQNQFKLGYEDAQAHPEFWEKFQFVRRKME